MLKELVEAGGDTDTNCSVAGQLAGALLGAEGILKLLEQQLRRLPEFPWILAAINQFGPVLRD